MEGSEIIYGCICCEYEAFASVLEQNLEVNKPNTFKGITVLANVFQFALKMDCAPAASIHTQQNANSIALIYRQNKAMHTNFRVNKSTIKITSI